MELRTYWTIIWRRIWVVLLVVGVVALYAGYKYYQLRKTPGALTAYSSGVTIQIGLQPTSNGNTNTADYITVSESLADAFATGPILTSHQFDQDVLNQINQDRGQIEQHYGASADLGNIQNPGAIGQALSASRVHSLVTINATWITPAGAWAIANAVGEVSAAKMGNYLPYVITSNVTHATTGSSVLPTVEARVIGSAANASVVSGSSSSKVTLYILLVLLALVIGIALAFLLDYLDDRIRSKDEVSHLLGLPIYAEVPRAPVPGRSPPSRIR